MLIFYAHTGSKIPNIKKKKKNYQSRARVFSFKSQKTHNHMNTEDNGEKV